MRSYMKAHARVSMATQQRQHRVWTELPGEELVAIFTWLNVFPQLCCNGVASANRRLNVFWRQYLRTMLRDMFIWNRRRAPLPTDMESAAMVLCINTEGERNADLQ